MGNCTRGRRRFSCCVLFPFKCREQLADIGRQDTLSKRFRQQLCHWRSFIDKNPDEALRFRECQRLAQRLHRFPVCTLRAESDRLQNHCLESFILPVLRLCLLPVYRQHPQCCNWVTLCQQYTRLAARQPVRLRKLSRLCQIPLAEERQHSGGSNLGYPVYKVMLTRGLASFRQDRGRGVHLSL